MGNKDSMTGKQPSKTYTYMRAALDEAGLMRIGDTVAEIFSDAVKQVKDKHK